MNENGICLSLLNKISSMKTFTSSLFILIFPVALSAQPVKLQSNYELFNSDILQLRSKKPPVPWKSQAAPIPIGDTFYDLQTNGSSYNSVYLSNNVLSVAWNNEGFLGAPFVGNAYFDGTTWIPQMDTTGLSQSRWPNT